MSKTQQRETRRKWLASATCLPSAPQMSAEDAILFQKIYANVSPLNIKMDTYQHQRKPCSPYPRKTPLDLLPNLDNSANEIRTLNQTCDNEGLHPAGQHKKLLKQMRRRDWKVERELDLHGMTGDEAEAAVRRFVNICQQLGLQRLRIIHGKGLHSQDQEPILKKRIHQWLIRQNTVLAFTHPNTTQGGSGAVLVLIKKARR